MATRPDLYSSTTLQNDAFNLDTESFNVNSIATSINPSIVTLDVIYENDIDWGASEFPNWVGNPRDLFGNVQNGGIYNNSVDNPKYFILRLIRTRQMRTFGIGASSGNFSNIKVSVLGSSDATRGVLDLSEEPSKQTSMVYSEEEFAFNSIKVEFFTDDRVDVSNIFMEHTASDKKQEYIHKFGINNDIGIDGNETVWTLGDTYIFTTTPQPYVISSSNANDIVEIQGEVIIIDDGGRYRVINYSVNIQGQAKVAIPTPNGWLCVASNRAFNANGSPLLGDVYIYEDTVVTGGVPQVLSKVRSIIEQSREQTEQCVLTVPEFTESGQLIVFAELYQWNVAMIKVKDSSGKADLIVANKGKVPRIQSTRGISNNYSSGQIYGENTPLIIDTGSDVYVQVSEITANDVAIQAGFTIKYVVI